MALVGEDGGSGLGKGWMMTAGVDDDYNGEEMTVASNAGDNRLAMMAATMEDSGGRQQLQWRTTAVADDNGGG
jgi:hypothetical protein